MINNAEKLVKGYTEWLGSEIEVRCIDEWIEVTTPFLDRHNDFLQIFASRRGEDWVLTDDAYVITDLSQSGCDIERGSRREEMLYRVLKGYGVRREENDQLVVRASDQEFSQRIHDLLQAMMSVDDLFFTTQATTFNLFFVDVRAWLSQTKVRFTPDVKFTGSSGYDHRFDFVIPSSENLPERVLQSANRPNRGWAERLAFSWLDTRDTRPEGAKAFAILNDESHGIGRNLVDALESYDIQTFVWSEREEVVEQLR
jgi:hypothetical protein